MLQQQEEGEQSQRKQNAERRTNGIRGRQPPPQQRDLQYVDMGDELNVLVVLMQWTNHPDRDKAVTKEQYEALFSGEGRDPELYPGGSVREYFNTISYGEFSMNFVVTPWIMTDYSEQDFTTDGSMGRNPNFQNALEPVLQQLDDDLFDFEPFDSDYDRELDLTVFLHSGYDAMAGGTDCEAGVVSTNRVASQAHPGTSLGWRSSKAFHLGAYIVAPAFDGFCGTKIAKIGTLVHELIHPFGVPEMYDTGGFTETEDDIHLGGLDHFGVMASSTGNSGDLAWPGHPAAWTRIRLNWVEPIPIERDGTYDIRPVEQFPDIYKITKGYQDKEYLLLENRQPIDGDFDEMFFSPGGIAIYHVDENNWDVFPTNTKGNNPAGGPFLEGWPGNGKHYPIALLQADGLYELEQGLNGGQSADLWNDASQVLGPGNGEEIATDANYPNTDSYQNGNILLTGITLSNFQTKPGTNVMTFDVCGFETTDCPQVGDIPTTATADPTSASTTEPTGTGNVTEIPGEDATELFPTENNSTEFPTENNSTEFLTDDITEFPTILNSEAPTISNSEAPTISNSEAPTISNSEAPSQAPSNVQSSQPTQIERLVNGNCTIAAAAFSSDDIPKSVSNITDGEVHRTCNGEAREGAWYKIEAGSVSADEVIQASTCFPETNTMNTMSVFRGNDCEALECVATDSMPCKNGEVGNIFYWSSESDEDYYVFVHSVNSSDDTAQLATFSDGSLLLNVLSFPMTPNDECDSADNVLTDGSFYYGVTEGATPEIGYNSTCGIESAGVWYKVNGTGSSLQATTCLPETDHSTQIHIFSGESCGALTCISVEANNSAVCSDANIATNSATVNWESETDVEYFILVGSGDGSVGKFGLKVTELNAATNNACTGAESVLPGATGTSSIAAATNSFPYGAYCGLPLDTAGVWYEMEGTGNGMSFSTCPGNDYSSAISVFTGSDCDELQCVTGVATGDPNCGYDGVTATWLSQTNETYYIYVHGSAPNSYGSFEFLVDEFEISESNSVCSEALPLTDNESSFIQDSTENATYSAPTDTCGVEITSPGLWYTFEGTGYPFEISACKSDASNDTDTFDPSISLFSGKSCGELECVSGTTFSDQICGAIDDLNTTNRFLQDSTSSPDSFPPGRSVVNSQEGVTYHLLLHGQGPSSLNDTNFGDNVGNFELTVRSLAPPSAPPTAAPASFAPSAAPSIAAMSPSSPAQEESSKSKKSNKNLYWLLLLLLLLIPLVPIVVCCYLKCSKSKKEGDETKDARELDSEEAPSDYEQFFTEEMELNINEPHVAEEMESTSTDDDSSSNSSDDDSLSSSTSTDDDSLSISTDDDSSSLDEPPPRALNKAQSQRASKATRSDIERSPIASEKEIWSEVVDKEVPKASNTQKAPDKQQSPKASDKQQSPKASDKQKSKKVSDKQKSKKVSDKQKSKKVSDEQKSPKASDKQKSPKVSDKPLKLGLGSIVSFQCKFIHPHRHREKHFSARSLGQRLTDARVVRRALKKIKSTPTLCVVVHHEDFKDKKGFYQELFCNETHIKVEKQGDPNQFFEM